MYGLADRIARSAIHQNHPTPVVELAPRGSIMVVDRDPAMLAMVRSALEGSCHIVVARDAGEALSQIEWARPEALLADAGLGADELDLLAAGWRRSAATTCRSSPSTPLSRSARPTCGGSPPAPWASPAASG